MIIPEILKIHEMYRLAERTGDGNFAKWIGGGLSFVVGGHWRTAGFFIGSVVDVQQQ
jgi:hypothetical protein